MTDPNDNTEADDTEHVNEAAPVEVAEHVDASADENHAATEDAPADATDAATETPADANVEVHANADATTAENGAAGENGATVENGASTENGATENGATEEPKEPFVVEEWMYGAIEAIVFASTEPVTPAKAREILSAEFAQLDPPKGEPGLGDVKAMFRTLLERWSDPTRTVAHGFRVVDVDGGLTFRTAAANARYIRRMQMGKPQKLSRATLETLAVVAYKQPVTKPQIEEVRGVDSSAAIKALLDKKLVRVLGKAEEIGRPLLYGTTKTFLELFEMQSLTDLPTLKELHELEHGVQPEAPADPDDRGAVVMDLFNAEQVSAVSEETERESNEAMEALEKALGEAKDVAKRASSLVLGVKVDDEEDKKEPTP